jgi:hypothetical protein
MSAYFLQLASNSSTSLDALQKELRAWDANYDGAAGTSGPAKWRLHAEFMQNTYSSIMAGVVQRQEQAAKLERAQAAEKAQEFGRRLKQVSNCNPSL